MHIVGCITHIFDTEIGIQQTMACSARASGEGAPEGQLLFRNHILFPLNLDTAVHICSAAVALNMISIQHFSYNFFIMN